MLKQFLAQRSLQLAIAILNQNASLSSRYDRIGAAVPFDVNLPALIGRPQIE